ncbi:MAG TPA: hypothetical protein VLJ38_11640 [Polyangiaceae bacterium]|nr:hypothetical protein [Polyangiaceae bacterium]
MSDRARPGGSTQRVPEPFDPEPVPVLPPGVPEVVELPGVLAPPGAVSFGVVLPPGPLVPELPFPVSVPAPLGAPLLGFV